MTLLRERSSFLHDLDANDLLAQAQDLHSHRGRSPKKEKKKPLLTEQQMQTTVAVYHFLCLAPSEYLPRASRSDFVRYGLAADLAIFLQCQHLSFEESKLLSRWRMSLRVWMYRMVQNFGFVEILVSASHAYS